MVEPDRQQSSTGGTRLDGRASVGSFHGFHDDQGLRLDPRPTGFAFDRFLIFGTGGWAAGNPSTAFALTGAAPFVTTGGRSNGWTVGGGLEYAITDTMLSRIEYRYTDLQTSGFVSIPANIADGGTRTPISDFRVGFAYKFAP